jgi:hypothetical protein
MGQCLEKGGDNERIDQWEVNLGQKNNRTDRGSG